MTTKVSADEVQQVRDLIIATCQYDEHYFSQGVRALYVVGALKDERDTLASHADPLRRALEELETAARVVFDGLNDRIDAACASGGTSVPVFAGIAALSDALHVASATLSSGENENGE